MQFHCSNSVCKDRKLCLPEEYAEKLGRKCLTCGSALVPVQSLDELEEDVIANYPHIIALPFQRMLDKKEADSKNKLFVDVLTNVLKYLALTLESEYLRSDYQDEKLNEIIEKLLLDSINISAWNIFLIQAIPTLEKAGHSFFLHELPSFFRKVEEFPGYKMKDGKVMPMGKRCWDENGDSYETTEPITPLAALINYRNRFVHSTSPSEKEASEGFEHYYAVLKNLLKEMKWCRKYPMYKREADQVHLLMGAVACVSEESIPENESETNLIIGHPDGESYLPLVPFFVAPSDYLPVQEIAEGEDLLIYDSNTGKSIEYCSPAGNHRSLETPFKHWRKLFEAKKRVLAVLGLEDLEAEEIRSRCSRVSQETKESLRTSGKVIDGLYFHREKIESDLIAWPQTSFPLAVLTSSVGAGKTCMLDSLVSRWERDGFPTFFVQARDLSQDDFRVSLRNLLTLESCVNPTDLVSRGTDEGKPLLIVVDGLDEHPKPGGLMADLIGFCREAGDARRVKALLSYRDDHRGGWDAVSAEDRPLFYEVKKSKEEFLSIESGPDHAGKPPAFRLESLSPQEVAKCWKAFAQYKQVKNGKSFKRFKTTFNYADVEDRNRNLALMLRKPLLLRLFLEVYQGQSCPRSFTCDGVFGRYFEFLAERTRDEGAFLLNFARLCLEHGQNKIDLDLLHRDDRTREAMRGYVGAPYNRLIREGVLCRSRLGAEGVSVSFVVEAFMEHVLGRILIIESKANTVADLAEALESNQSFRSIYGACKYALTRRVEEEGVRFLADFVQRSKCFDELWLAGLVLGQLVLESENPAQLAMETFPVFSANELRAASEAADYLVSELAFDKAGAFLDQIVEAVKAPLDHSEEMSFFLGKQQGIKRWRDQFEQALHCAEKALVIDLAIAREPEDSGIAFSHLNLGENYWLNGKFDEAIEHFEKALEIYSKTLTPDSLPFGKIHLNLGLVYLERGEFEMAIESQKRALAIYLEFFDPDDLRLLESYQELGNAYCASGGFDEAIQLHEKVYDLALQNLGQNHPFMVEVYGNLGAIHSQKGNLTKGAEFIEKAIGICGPKAYEAAKLFGNLGNVHSSLGDFSKGIGFYQKSLAITKKFHGPDHIYVAHFYHNLGMGHKCKGEWSKAIDCFKKALVIQTTTFGTNHADVLASCRQLAMAYKEKKHFPQAIAFNEKALGIAIEILGESHIEIAEVCDELSYAFARDENYEQALFYAEKSFSVKVNLLGSDHPDTTDAYDNLSEAYNNLGEAYNIAGEFDKSIECHEKSLAINLKVSEDLALIDYKNIGLNYLQKGDKKSAKENCLKAKKISLKLYGPDNPITILAQKYMDEIDLLP